MLTQDIYYSRNQFGIGIELGIGIDMQPDADTINIASRTKRIATLSPFLNFMDSPINLYNTA